MPFDLFIYRHGQAATHPLTGLMSKPRAGFRLMWSRRGLYFPLSIVLQFPTLP